MPNTSVSQILSLGWQFVTPDVGFSHGGFLEYCPLGWTLAPSGCSHMLPSSDQRNISQNSGKSSQQVTEPGSGLDPISVRRHSPPHWPSEVPFILHAWAELALSTRWVWKRLCFVRLSRTSIHPLRTSVGGQFKTQSYMLGFRPFRFHLPAEISHLNGFGRTCKCSSGTGSPFLKLNNRWLIQSA